LPTIATEVHHVPSISVDGRLSLHGATSVWERWDGWTADKGFQNPGMNSFAARLDRHRVEDRRRPAHAERDHPGERDG